MPKHIKITKITVSPSIQSQLSTLTDPLDRRESALDYIALSIDELRTRLRLMSALAELAEAKTKAKAKPVCKSPTPPAKPIGKPGHETIISRNENGSHGHCAQAYGRIPCVPRDKILQPSPSRFAFPSVRHKTGRRRSTRHRTAITDPSIGLPVSVRHHPVILAYHMR